MGCSKCRGFHSWLITLCSYKYSCVNRLLSIYIYTYIYHIVIYIFKYIYKYCNALGCSKCGVSTADWYLCVSIIKVMSIDHDQNIYIYIHMCCNVLGCSKCGGLHSWLIILCSYKSSYVNRLLYRCKLLRLHRICIFQFHRQICRNCI